MKPDDLADIDTKKASSARIYDYMLGGTDNYAVDRMAADQVEELLPGTKAMARNNRRFLERVVRYLAQDCGIRQFIDNGSGLPTRDNVHNIAQRVAPQSRVVYVDNDPVVLRHQKVGALAGNENTAFILADARDVDHILDREETARLLNVTEPTAVLYLAFLHFIPDEDDPWGMVREMMSRVAPGSYLAISQISSEDPGFRHGVSEFFRDVSRGRYARARGEREIRAFFDGLELVEPGLVDMTAWHPDGRDEEPSDRWVALGGVARKPA